MKWRALDNGPSRQAGLAACDWLRDNRIRIRGHNLMWPQWKWVPFLEQFKDRPAELTRIIDAHLDETLAAFKGRTFCWDVVNEADPENDLTRVIGTPTYDSWWKRCKQLDPGALTISNGGWPSDDLLAYWDEHRLPVDGVGYEAHIGGIPEPPEDILRQADRVAKHGKEIQVTEFDNTIIEPGLQSDYMRDFMTACFSHPSVTAIVMWGFWDGNHWLASAPLFNKDWTLKPGGTAWMDLVFSRWWTKATGATDAAGRYRLRGFLGDYAVTVTTHGTSRTTRLSLPREGAQATITIP
jgi:GH35 family endo-1,4-beta-xylanase